MFNIGDTVRDIKTGGYGKVVGIHDWYLTVDMYGMPNNPYRYSSNEIIAIGRTGAEQALLALQEHSTQRSARSVTRDTTLAYAHDAGNFGSALRHIRSLLVKHAAKYGTPVCSDEMYLLSWIETVCDDALSASLITYPGDDDEGISPNFSDDPS